MTVVLERPCLGSTAFRLLAVSDAYGGLEQAVETVATTAWCTGCGVRAVPQGRRQVRVRDLPSAGRQIPDPAGHEDAAAALKLPLYCSAHPGEDLSSAASRHPGDLPEREVEQALSHRRTHR